jgi:hypothetical protein
VCVCVCVCVLHTYTPAIALQPPLSPYNNWKDILPHVKIMKRAIIIIISVNYDNSYECIHKEDGTNTK